MIRSHTFESTREAYDTSQCSDAIRDGDVLFVPSEERIAVLLSAWPVTVVPHEHGPGEFHELADNTSWVTVEHGRYAASATVALALYTAHELRGLGPVPVERMLKLARSMGWAGEIPAQERFNHERDPYDAG